MWKYLGFVASTFGLAGAAHAAGAGITYDCDTAAGHFSELVLPAPSGPFTIVGNITVNTIAKDKKWAPSARVRIGSAPAGPGAAPSAFAGFSLAAVPGKAVSMNAETVQAFSFEAAGGEPQLIPASLGPTGSVQPFRLSFDGRAVAVAIGAEARSYPLVVNQPVVQIICSTGEFLMTDIKIEPTP